MACFIRKAQEHKYKCIQIAIIAQLSEDKI